MFIGYIPGVGGDDMDYGPAPGLNAPRPSQLTFPIRITLPAPPVIPKAPPMPAPRTPTWQAPRFPFEAAFSKAILLAVRVRLAERAPILISSGANVCAALARLAPRPARMCDLVDCLVTANMWNLDVNKLALLDATKELLGFLMANNPAGNPEEWVSMLDWLIAGAAGVRLTRRQTSAMLNSWRADLAAGGIDSRTLLVLLQGLGAHLQPNVLHALTRQHASAMGVVTLRTLCNQAWTPPIALANGVVAPAAPIFSATLWAAVQALAQL